MRRNIGYEVEKRGAFPQVWCAGCGKIIVLADSGVDSHAKVIRNKAGVLKFMHQMCDDDTYQSWESVDNFFRHLLHNLRLTPQRLAQPDPFDGFDVATKPRGRKS